MRTRLAVPFLAMMALASCNSAANIVAIENTTFAPGLGVSLANSTKTASGVYYRDINAGGGAVVAAGHTLAVHYTGWLADGTVFDANSSGQTPFSFVIGQGFVIQGWDDGLVGMHVGGTRQLIIPPILGYGSSDHGPIPGNSVLVFSVNVVSSN